MKILAIEFSTDQRSVAVVVDGSVRAVAVAAAPNAFGAATTAKFAARSTPAFALIDQALAEARLEREQIECLAIGLGPGSYAGIRAAIALAQGWQLAQPVKLLGISSIECLAAEAQAKSWSGRVNLAIDAQRNELYLASYDINSGSYQEVTPLELASLDEARKRSSAGGIMAGPDINRWFPEGLILFPSAGILGLLAANRSNFVAGEKLEPIYLRETTFVKAPPSRTIPAN